MLRIAKAHTQSLGPRGLPGEGFPSTMGPFVKQSPRTCFNFSFIFVSQGTNKVLRLGKSSYDSACVSIPRLSVVAIKLTVCAL